MGVLITFLDFACTVNTHHLPEYPSTYQLHRRLISNNAWNSCKSKPGILEQRFVSAQAIMKVAAQP